MRVLKRICDGIGTVSEWSGRIAMFLVIVLVTQTVITNATKPRTPIAPATKIIVYFACSRS